jgi:hypothetical protein
VKTNEANMPANMVVNCQCLQQSVIFFSMASKHNAGRDRINQIQAEFGEENRLDNVIENLADRAR